MINVFDKLSAMLTELNSSKIPAATKIIVLLLKRGICAEESLSVLCSTEHNII